MASAKPDFALPPQTVLHARYLLGDTLGGGALGITYRAVQLDAPARGRVVAVKEFFPRALAVRAADGSVQPMPKGAADFALYCAQFVRGYRVLRAKADCPPLVPLLDLFEQNGTAYVVMAYIEGETLAQRVEAHGAIPPRALMRMMRPFLHDLAALHRRQIIHRAIMPENILLRGENPPMLLDFGGARPESDSLLMRCPTLRGSGYLPPEQTLQGKQGSWTDVYALCATMYYALTASRMPDAMTRLCAEKSGKDDPLVPIRTLCPKLPRKQADALMAGLSLDSAARPADFAALESALYGSKIPHFAFRIPNWCARK